MESSDGDDSFLRAVAAAPFISLPGHFTGNERFELVRVLGEGGFGRVYEAVDHRHGGRLALKLLRRSDGLYEFKHEFRALATLLHPNLVRLYELVASERSWFFTMELIDGAPLLEFARVSEWNLRDAFGQLAKGLLALHCAGIVHRDVKPSNVLVDRSGRTGRAVLLDFGLAVELEAAAPRELAGTPLYMSPEQGAGGEVGAASDWYAFGTMLYEALAGRPPFSGPWLLENKLAQAPPPLPPGAPPDLARMAMALLARDPEARPGGDVVVGHFRKSGVQRPARRARSLVGRLEELEILGAQLDDTRLGRRTVTLIRGPSGVGKSALLKQFLDEAEKRGALVLSGRCHQQESVPYKALDPIIDELARRLPSDDALVPPDAAALVQLFPVFKQVEALSRARGRERIEPAQKQSRGVAALRELLARVARRQPVVIAVDDLQWGDGDSAMLLAALVRPPDPPPVCFVGCFRGEEAATSPLLTRLSELRGSLLAEVPVRELTLRDLQPEDAETLARLLLRERDGDPAQIAVESRGNPFFVHELARDAGVSLPELVARRVSRLPPAARALLEAVAVAGVPVGVEVAAEAAGVGAEARDLYALLRGEHLLRGRDAGVVECYHERIREAVAGALGDQDRRRLAKAIEGRVAPDSAWSAAEASYLAGRWREARVRLEAAVDLQPEAARRYLADTLYYLGDFAAGSPWAALARDDPDAAVEALRGGPDLELRYRVEIDLYRRDGEAALARLEQMKPGLNRVQWADLEARALLCARKDYKRVEKLASRILVEKTVWGEPLALLLKAQVAVRRDDLERAEPLLSKCIDGFAAADMPLHQASARRARGLILPDAARIIESAEASLAALLVRRPDRLAAMLVPGI